MQRQSSAFAGAWGEHAMSSRLFAIFALFAALAAAPRPAVAQETLTIFAAASLRNALDDVDAIFAKATGVKITASYAASSALAKQIAQGAPADVYVSANIRWMGFLEKKKLIAPGTRINLLGNRLVLIAPKDSKLDQVKIEKGFDIANLAGKGRIAVANTKAVPAGLYAKAALTSLGAWQEAEPKLAQAENVRATLAYVARGETPLGIVYATDARIEPKVKIIGAFPAGSHPAITYPVAGLAASKNPHVTDYLSFLQTPAAKAIFEKYGFSSLVAPRAS
jgi:molybdate transport system substrate-binding protein